MNQVVLWTSVAAGAISAGRWLRVAQREHYGIGRTSRFARRWWLLDWANRLWLAAAAAGVVLSGTYWWAPSITAAAVVIGPQGLDIRGRTSPLAWTRRLATLATALALLWLVLVGVGLLTGLAAPVLAVLLFGMPLWTDVSLALLAPFEAVLSRRWVRRAQQRLERIDPVRVAVTGSYGKTTIKGYLRQLTEGNPISGRDAGELQQHRRRVPQRQRALGAGHRGVHRRDGHLLSWRDCCDDPLVTAIGVDPGVDRALCTSSASAASIASWPPRPRSSPRAARRFSTSMPTACGPEADRLAASGLRVVRCSTQDAGADVTVLRADGSPAEPGVEGDAGASFEEAVDEATVPRHITAFGRRIDTRPLGHAAPGNVACAVAAASVLGVSDDDIARRLADLPTPEHRRTAAHSDGGVMVIDDTYNSNPAGARAALEMLANTEAGRRVVVTPGMVELGRTQAHENRLLGEHAARIADDVLVVGRTNRTALLGGAAGWDNATARRATRGRGARSPGARPVRGPRDSPLRGRSRRRSALGARQPAIRRCGSVRERSPRPLPVSVPLP